MSTIPSVKREPCSASKSGPADGSTGGERAEVHNQYKLSNFQDGDTVVMAWGVMIDSAFK